MRDEQRYGLPLHMIHSGFVIVWASSGTTVLGWGVSSDDQDDTRVSMMRKAILDAFPEFRRADHPVSHLAEVKPMACIG